jgi:hypothetical protein
VHFLIQKYIAATAEVQLVPRNSTLTLTLSQLVSMLVAPKNINLFVYSQVIIAVKSHKRAILSILSDKDITQGVTVNL